MASLCNGKVPTLWWSRAARAMSVLLVCLANLQQHTAQAGFVLEIQLNNYFSNTHSKADGFCCKALDNFPCTVECNNRFLFCLQPSNQSVPDSSCPLGNYTTGNISGDNAMFPVGEYLDDGVPNPMVFTGPRWPGSLNLYVQVDNVDTDSPQSSEVDGDQLVAQFDVFIDISLEGNRTTMVDRMHYYDRLRHGTFLFLTIELSCEENYYGAECDKFCQSRDDESGHYVCDNDGNIICLEGFYNEATNCSAACSPSESGCYLDACLHLVPCLNGATCINTGPDGYECVCEAGFEGRNCSSQETTECQPDTCKNGGTCEDTDLDFVCKCPIGFTGKYCETDINECLSNPCLNGGSCQDAKGDYLCTCVGGFTGKTCKDNPKAVGFAAIVGGGAVGYLLLILIAVVLIAIIVWIARQLKREKGIAAAGDLRGKEERMGGNRVSADNPTFHELETAEMETLKHVDLLYDDIYGHYHSEENDPCAIGDGEYSKLDHFRANDLKPRIADRSNFPHYSSLDVNADNVCSLERPSSSSCKTTRDHQYEDIDIKQDGEGEKKDTKHEDPETLKRNYYERISIDTSLELSVSQQALSNDTTNIDNQYGSETDNRHQQENVDLQTKFENPQTATKVMTKEKVGILCVQEEQLKQQQHSELLKT